MGSNPPAAAKGIWSRAPHAFDKGQVWQLVRKGRYTSLTRFKSRLDFSHQLFIGTRQLLRTDVRNRQRHFANEIIE